MRSPIVDLADKEIESIDWNDPDTYDCAEIGHPRETHVYIYFRVMGPLNVGCFDCFPLACPTSFSTYALPFQILRLNGTRFLPNWHKFFGLIATTYMLGFFAHLELKS